MIQRHQSTMRIIEVQAREARRLHEKSVAALNEQKKIVELFLDEDRRKSIMEKAYAIEAGGTPVLDQISTAGTVNEIEEILRDHLPQSLPSSLLSPPEGPKIVKAPADPSDLFSGGFDDGVDLFDTEEGEGQ